MISFEISRYNAKKKNKMNWRYILREKDRILNWNYVEVNGGIRPVLIEDKEQDEPRRKTKRQGDKPRYRSSQKQVYMYLSIT